MNPRKSNRTIKMMLITIGIVGSLVISNVLFTMVTHTHYRSGINVVDYKKGDNIVNETISAPRGNIMDRNGEIIAQDKETYTVFVYLDKERYGLNKEPAFVTSVDETAIALAPILETTQESLASIMNLALAAGSKEAQLGTAGKNISKSQKEAIEALGLPGIGFIQTSDRYYPVGKFASNLIGFAQYTEEAQRIVGIQGAEKSLDEYLVGTDGLRVYQKNADGEALPGTEHEEKKAVKGSNVYLTLDKNVQLSLESAMDKTMQDFSARRAWGIVMEVETGKILGWSSYPTFDLNLKNIEIYDNMPSQSPYEPGSVMKSFTYAAAIDSGVYPAGQYFTANEFHIGYDQASGKILRSSKPVDGFPTINDALGKKFGTITYDVGFLRSSNVGICCLLTDYLDPSVFEQYLDKFGFFKEVGTPGVLESPGIKSFSYPSDKLSTGFGQASSVTALQLMQGYSAIFNDGKMMKPYYIDRIVDGYNSDTIIKQYEPEVAGQPISKETSEYMRGLMRQVVDDPVGTAHGRYNMDDVTLLAKTGTAQIAENGSYTNGYHINSIMAAAPADDPKIMFYYAFESKEILNFSGEYFKQVLKEALIASNVTGDKTLQSNNSEFNEYNEYTMPSLINHTSEYAAGKLTNIAVNRVIIGEGNSVVRQFPNAGETVTTGQNIFLLMDGSSLKMPNMIGWTRKDISTFWDLTGIAITMDGNGSVVEQSIQEGDTIDRYTEITVKLQ